MREKTHWSVTLVRILLIVLSLCIWTFIFYNALSDGEASSKQSHSVTVSVQEAVGAINPSSPIATAKGESFDFLHAHIRNLAHFLQYFALGACVFGAYLSFAKKGNVRYAYVPPCLHVCARVQPWWIQGIQSGDGVGELDTIALIKY